MKYNIFLLIVLLIINNFLHYISEKTIIATFVIIFFLLIKLLNNIITENYNLKVKAILHDVNNYINSLLVLYYTKKNTLYFNLLLNSSFKKLNTLLMNYSKKLIGKQNLYLINVK